MLKKTILKIFPFMMLSMIILISAIPLLQSGFSGDDIPNSLIRGILEVNHITLFNLTKNIILSWYNNGRFYPIPFIFTYSLFYLIGDHLYIYNFVHFAGIILTLILASLLIKKISQTNLLSFLFLSLIPISWSLYPGSPLTSYMLTMPLVTCFMLITFYHYINILQTKRLKYFLYVSISYVLSLLTYEIALVTVPIIFILNRHYEKSYLNHKNIFPTSLIFIITLIYLSLIIYLRHYHSDYPGVSIGALNQFPITFLKQAAGVLPLYVLFLGKGIHVSTATFLIGLFLGLLLSFFIFTHLQLKQQCSNSKLKTIFFIGLLVNVLPATLIGLSKKYQGELIFGISHIPIFIQQIGFCLMLTSIIYFISRLKLGRQVLGNGLISVIIASFITLSFLANVTYTNYFNELTRYSRDIFELSLKKGLFKDLPINTTIIKPYFVGIEQLWNTRTLRAQLINRSDIVVFDFHGRASFGDEQFKQEFENRLTENSSLFYLDFDHLLKFTTAGYSLVGHIFECRGKVPNLSIKLDKVKIFYVAKDKKSLEEVFKTIKIKYKIVDNEKVLIADNQAKLTGFINLPYYLNVPNS